MANLQGLIITFLLSQTAWPLLYTVEKFSVVESPSTVFIAFGTAALLVVILVLKFLLPRDAYSKTNKKIEKRGLLFYMSCLFSWSCVISTVFYLEAVELVSGFAGFYLKVGEPYLNTSFGTLCNLWDGVVHFFLYLKIIYCIDNGKDYRDSVLFYLGSMLCSMTHMLFGGLAGIHGDFYPATLLIVPYVFFPIYMLFLIMNSPRPISTKLKSKEKLNNTSLRIFLVMELSFLIIYGIVRGWAAMKSPHPAAVYYVNNIEPYVFEPAKFGYIWAILMMFVGFAYQTSSIFALYHPGCSWIFDWSMFFAGFKVFGSVMMMAQFLPGVAREFHPPFNSMAMVVVSANFMVALVAVLTAYLVRIESGFFVRPTASTSKKGK